MSKQDIFSKIQIVDYNNMLENVLESKDFTEDVKNLLLSMLYKIENGYEDYKTIKVNTTSKKNFLKKIIQIIQDKCEKIEIVKPMSFQSVELEKNKVNYIVNKEKKSIKVYQNEKMMLEAIIAIDQKEINLSEKYDLYGDSIKNLLIKGNIMSNSEVIRDFNGWSWDITSSQLDNKNINIIYQNLLILLGNSFMQKLVTGKIELEEIDIPNNEILRSKYNENFGITKDEIEENKEDYLELIKQNLIDKCGEKNAEDFIIQFIKAAIVIESNINNKQKNKIIEVQDKLKNELDLIQDNKKYLEKLSKTKKELNLKIKEIDTLLNNDKLLKEEYTNRNKKLSNEEKIFSISHLSIMLEKERIKYLEEIKDINKKMEPKEFVKIKEELQNNYLFFEDMDIKNNSNSNEEKQIDKLENIFLNCIEEIIKNEEDKEELKKLIYVLRYYGFIPYKDKNIVLSESINNRLEEIKKLIVEKTCKNKILTIFSENNELNYDIIGYLFQCKIANLENIIYILKYHKGILKVQIYDGNIEEEIKEIKITEKVELNTKLNKKIKVFE